MLTKITLEVARSKNVLVQLRPSSKLWARILQHFQTYTCTFFLLLCLPKALRYHLTVYKHVCMSERRRFRPTGEYVVYTYSSTASAKVWLKSLKGSCLKQEEDCFGYYRAQNNSSPVSVVLEEGLVTGKIVISSHGIWIVARLVLHWTIDAVATTDAQVSQNCFTVAHWESFFQRAFW